MASKNSKILPNPGFLLPGEHILYNPLPLSVSELINMIGYNAIIVLHYVAFFFFRWNLVIKKEFILGGLDLIR